MRTALITGASSGIGLELAKIHGKEGDNLVLVARSEGKLSELKNSLEKDYDIKVRIISADLSDLQQPKRIYDTLQKEKIEIDYLINNAGIGDFGLFAETDWEKEKKMIDLNIDSLTLMTKLFLPDMIKRKKGRIMNLASTASFQPGPLMAVYYATKHYVLAFSEAIANEVKEHGVTVTALCPGPTRSGFQDTANLQGSKLVENAKLPSSEEVAIYGYKQMMKGKTVAIHGFMNKIMATSVKFMPRKVVTNVVRKLSEKE